MELTTALGCSYLKTVNEMTSKIKNSVNIPDLMPARMLNEFVYCPRLFYLEWVESSFEDSADTIEGRLVHRNVDTERGSFYSPDKNESNDQKIHATSVLLSGSNCGLIARIDLLEGSGREVSPVEYKKGEKPKIAGEAWLSDKIQICAQSLILKENGYECKEGIIYYAATKQRVVINITENIIKDTLKIIDDARKLASSENIPPPLKDSSKCSRCSLVGICLPDETNSLLLSSHDNTEKDIRRLYPARDDSLPVYVQEQGAYVSKKNEELYIKLREKTLTSVRLMEISQLSVFGNVQITTQTVQELCQRNIPICYFSYGGWFYGITHGMSNKNVELRRLQYSTNADPTKSIKLARNFIQGKIKNSRTVLRRNSKAVSKKELDELKKWEIAASNAKNSETLLGIEGTAARIYFSHFSDMLKNDGNCKFFSFELRNRRPPRDPVNAVLSYVYALLTKDMTLALLSTGFDPYLGFYHKPKYGRPALALDMIEEFRPIIGDSVVINLINNGEISDKNFLTRGNATTLTSEGKKIVIKAYERRMDTLIIHPIFGYKVSYRRILEVQARLLARTLSGEINEYPMFCTR